MRNITFLTIVAHVIGIVTVFIIYLLFFDANGKFPEQPAILLLMNSIYITYYIFIGTLCYPQSRRHQLVSLIPLSVFGALSWLLALVLFISNMNNPFAFAFWSIEWLYNGNCILLLAFHSLKYLAESGYIYIYIPLKLLYNILFPTVFIFAGMELKRFLLKKRGEQVDGPVS